MSEDIKIEKNIPVPDRRGKPQKYPLNVYNLEVKVIQFSVQLTIWLLCIFLRLKRKGKGFECKYKNNGVKKMGKSI